MKLGKKTKTLLAGLGVAASIYTGNDLIGQYEEQIYNSGIKTADYGEVGRSDMTNEELQSIDFVIETIQAKDILSKVSDAVIEGDINTAYNYSKGLDSLNQKSYYGNSLETDRALYGLGVSLFESGKYEQSYDVMSKIFKSPETREIMNAKNFFEEELKFKTDNKDYSTAMKIANTLKQYSGEK